MEALFVNYITRFPFWGDFLYSDLKKLVPNLNNRKYIELCRWYGAEENQERIAEIRKEHAVVMEELKENDLKKFQEQKQNVKLKIPSVSSLNNYIGMFDEH